MAKQTKKLTRDQKELLEKEGYESANCRFVEDRDGTLIFVDTTTDEEFVVYKEEVKKVPVNIEERRSGSAGNLQSFEYNLFTN